MDVFIDGEQDFIFYRRNDRDMVSLPFCNVGSVPISGRTNHTAPFAHRYCLSCLNRLP